MAEGLFAPEVLGPPGLAPRSLRMAMVRVLPRTPLHLDLAPDRATAQALARNTIGDDGCEHWHRWYTREDIGRCEDPLFALGMVNHEFCRVVQQGGRFPASMVLDGGGSGVAVSAGGHVLTNHHLVVGEVEQAGRKSGSIDSEQPCRHLRVQVARPDEKRGGWQWVDAERALLVSNPAESDAYRASPDPRYRYRLHADLALLRIEPAPAHWLPLSRRVPTIGESVWMAGCPLRTARRSARYRDADASLRVSMGKVLALGTDEPDGEGFIVTDVDGAAGSSGSPLFDAHGRIIGLFSRVLDGASSRNAVEYDAVRRVHVPASMIEPLLGSGLPAFSD